MNLNNFVSVTPTIRQEFTGSGSVLTTLQSEFIYERCIYGWILNTKYILAIAKMISNEIIFKIINNLILLPKPHFVYTIYDVSKNKTIRH